MRLVTDNSDERIDTTLGDIILAIQESVAEEFGTSDEDSAHITQMVLERIVGRCQAS